MSCVEANQFIISKFNLLDQFVKYMELHSNQVIECFLPFWDLIGT